MPHMDMSGSDAAEYADHEVQAVGVRADLSGGNPNEGASTGAVQFEPVSDRGLDSDELAELVGFYRYASLNVLEEQDEVQEFIGDVEGEFEAGINLAGKNEFVTDAPTNNSTAEEIENVSPGIGRAFNFAEPGALDFGNLCVTPGQIPGVGPELIDAPAGAGSGSAGAKSQRFVDMRSFLGSGPYVDRTDDLTLKAEVDNFDSQARAKLEVSYLMYWNVEEMPEGRASFARP